MMAWRFVPTSTQRRNDRRNLRLTPQRSADALQRRSQIAGGVGAQRRMADLATGARLLAVVVPVATGFVQHGVASGIAPIQLSMQARPTMRVSPSGNPSTARR